MIYAVSGMARSGTSMMMHALIKGGIPAIYDVGKDDVRLRMLKKMGYDANHNGLFELYKDNLKEKFPYDLDGEVVKIQDTQWEQLDRYAENGIRVVYMLRDKECVLKSMYAFTGSNHGGRNARRWDKQYDYIQSIKDRHDVKSVDVLWYADVVEDPEKYFIELKEHGFPINVEKACSVVNPEYQHFRSEI